MSKIGFATASTESTVDDIIKTDQTEDFTHIISFLGIPFYKSKKIHIIDSKQIGK